MSIKKKDKLLLNLLEGEKHRHRVAMVNEEEVFNQHEPNSNMARIFVVMLLIHVVVIGGIIIYDFMNGEAAPATELKEDYAAQAAAAANSMPAPAVDLDLVRGGLSEEFSTYDWKSGDSIPIVAKKLEVSEDVLIRLNKVDQGRQIKTNDIIIYPKRPVVKAVGIPVAASAEGFAAPPPAPAPDSLTHAQMPLNMAVPDAGNDGFGFSATIDDQLIPEPVITPGARIEHNPPAAVTREASGTPVRVELPAAVTKADALPEPKLEEAPPAPAPKPEVKKEPEIEKPVPKAIPVPRPEPKPVVKEKPAVKKVEDAPPAKKETPKSSGGAHQVQSGETLYRIANKYGVSVSALQAANKNVKPESLQIGMKLVIPRK